MSTEDVITMEDRILEAAKQVFVRKGYEATKMGDVAAEAGIGRTALHYYYRTKEMLFDAIFDQLIGALLPNLGAIIDEDTSFLEKLPKIIDQYVKTLQRNPLFPIFVINELERAPEHIYHSILKNPSRIEPIIRMRRQMEKEMEQGLLKKLPVYYVATTLISLLVFPMLVRNPFTAIFMGGDAEKYEDFLQERIPFVTDIMIRLLTPDDHIQHK
ncbi:TetR/AcrR family transcriptional regulator [Parabacteroides gordonii]|jgi:TetR/AcrR family transcriptional regulator|uniref:TetR/AcrR family transcriptional regulator n=1 Tax=Parabacteroides gordonii TaxID=574930 RepID=UPI00241C5E94|nr:TetR/AcrR family transcriptional regulator [Parabacteroides gordonii]